MPRIGTDYDHIDAMNLRTGAGVVRHMLKDAKAREDVSELKDALSLTFEMVTVTNEQAITVANNYRYYLTTTIPKGAHCIFENTSNVQYTLNLGDGTNETSYGAIPAGTKKEFYAEFNASVIRCYCPANSTWKFTLSYGGVQDNSVAYFSQTQTDAKKATARNNIGAASKADFSKYVNKTDFETFSNNYMIGAVIGNSVSLSSTTPNWVYSSVPLFVKKGNTVHCSTRGSGMCAIATAPTNNFSGAVCRCPANDNTAVKEYTYTAESDCYAWISGRVNETTAYVDFKTLYDVAQQITGETYTVKKDGTGDYQTFTGMLDALKNNTNEKTVYVYPGTYDIFDELGGAEYVASITNPTSLNWADVNKLVPDNTRIIGVGNVVLSYEPEDSEMPSANHAFLFAALNIKDVSCTIENITINGKNCRYAVHIENGQSEKKIDLKFKGVRINMGNGGVRNAQAVGTGLGNNAKWNFIECDINNATNAGCFTTHTNVPLAGDSASVSFESCTFTIDNATETNTVNIVQLISAYNPTPGSVTDYARFTSCYVSGKIALVNGYDDREVTKKQLFNITMINNICNTLFVSDTFEATEPTRVYS